MKTNGSIEAMARALASHPRCRTRHDVMSGRPCALPCAPPATSANVDVQGGLDLREEKPTCAVVGSSDILRLDPRGGEIDAHSVVWRLNNAPTLGWEHAVGRRTSVRVVNHVPIEKWVRLARNQSALERTADGAEYHTRLCAPQHAPLGCVVSRMHGGSGFSRALAAYRTSYSSHHIHVASDALHRWGMRCNDELHGTSPSGGLLAVLLALATCASPVSLFGFWPFCCRSPGARQALNYKYFQGNRTRFVCCSRGRERMEVEYTFYEMLDAKGLVRLRAAPEALTGPVPPVPPRKRSAAAASAEAARALARRRIDSARGTVHGSRGRGGGGRPRAARQQPHGIIPGSLGVRHPAPAAQATDPCASVCAADRQAQGPEEAGACADGPRADWEAQKAPGGPG